VRASAENPAYQPDASWLSAQRIASLDEKQKVGFWPICPDVAIEVCSSSDNFEAIVAKTQAYIDRGAIYAVAIHPKTRGSVSSAARQPI
jgi:Uma2 family endonuclease